MLRIPTIAGALALGCSTIAYAQAAPPAPPQQSAPAVKPDTPAKTTTTAPVSDEAGNVAVQKSTDTTQTTTTEPASGAPAQSSTSQTTSTSTTAPDATGTPTTTTTTTSTEPAADATGATLTAATAADVKAGVPVFDKNGGVVGKVESVSAKGAVVSTGKARAEIPVSSFGKNDKGLVMSMSKTELEAASAQSAAKAPPKKK
jgi:hypothetical protein